MRISDWSSDVCSSDLQCRAQRAKPLIIGLPLPYAVAIDRTADLLGRGGAHRPRIGMEIHAGFFELKAEISEQRAPFGFGIVEQAFVDHAVQAPRQQIGRAWWWARLGK